MDRGDTDASGMLVLDVPAGEDWFITEIDDPNGGPTVEAGLTAAFVVIAYVASTDASAS